MTSEQVPTHMRGRVVTSRCLTCWPFLLGKLVWGGAAQRPCLALSLLYLAVCLKYSF
jgi:hypothetical protein